MRFTCRVGGLIVLAGFLAGCGGEVTPDKLPADQKDPNFGKSAQDKMNEMYPNLNKGAKKK